MNQTRFNCLVVNCRDDHQSDYSLVTLVEHLSYHMHSRGFTEHFEYQCLDCDAYFFNKVFMVRHKMQPEFQQHKIIHIPCKDLQNPTSDIKLATVVNELTDDLLRYRYKVSQSRSNGVSYAHKMMLTPRTPTRSATSGYTPRTPAMVHSSNSPPRTPRYGPGGDFSNSFANASLPTKTATYCRTPPRAVRYANLDDAGTDSSQPHHRRMQEALGISGCRDRPRFERSSHDNPSYRPRGGNDDGPRTRGGRGNGGYRGGRGGFDRSDDGNSRGGRGSFRGRGRGYRGRTDASMRPNDRSRSRSPMKKRKASPGRRSYSRSRSNTPDNSHSHNRIPPQKKPSRERRSYSRSPRSD